MKVLIVLPRIEGGPHVGHMNMVGSFESVYGNNKEFTYELAEMEDSPGYIRTPKDLDERLLKQDFDVALVTPCFQYNVSLETAKKLGKKLSLCIWDSYTEYYGRYPYPAFGSFYANNICHNIRVNYRMFLKSKNVARHHFQKHTPYEYSQYCNILAFDIGVDEEEFSNIYSSWVPLDSRIFTPSLEEEKIYDVTFGGSWHSEERKNMIMSLIDKGIDVKKFGGQRQSNDEDLSWEDYAKYHRMSKIGLNINKNQSLIHKNGRIFELAASNTLMLIKYPEALYSRGKYLFKENQHFLTFNDDNLYDIVKYYLDNPEERIKISTAMHEHYNNNYTASHFWNNVFDIYSKQ